MDDARVKSIDTNQHTWRPTKPTEFWAKFEPWNQRIIRLDTRIYLMPIVSPNSEDRCIGAIVGKNPGSAKRSTVTSPELQPIILAGDKLLPTVRNIIQKAYGKAGRKSESGEYIQVLNSFYLCEPSFELAVKHLQKSEGLPICETENLRFPWVWYVWGDECEPLNRFKERYTSIDCDKQFYYDKQSSKVVEKFPGVTNFAKHTQGLAHGPIVEYLSILFAKTKV